MGCIGNVFYAFGTFTGLQLIRQVFALVKNIVLSSLFSCCWDLQEIKTLYALHMWNTYFINIEIMKNRECLFLLGPWLLTVNLIGLSELDSLKFKEDLRLEATQIQPRNY